MILTMAYCLIHRKRFILMSHGANFSAGHGWTEFFEPFISENNQRLLLKFNYRDKPARTLWDRRLFRAYMAFHPNYHLTYDFIYKEIRTIDWQQIYTIQELGFSGSALQLCSQLDNMVWHYNETTAAIVKANIDSLRMHSNLHYIGLHIRRGDKITEHALYDIEKYMDMAQKYSNSKYVFVLTDDYLVIEDLHRKYPEYTFYTLCQPNERGYDFHNGLQKLSFEDKKASLIRLWSSMDILTKAECFVGTYSTNPGVTLGFRMSAEKMHCLDFDNWLFW